MKYVLLAGLMVMMVVKSWGQVKVYRNYDESNKDSIISSGTDTLDGYKQSKRNFRVTCGVTISLIKNGNSKDYKMYLYFSDTKVFSLTQDSYVYIFFTDGSDISIRYNGDYKIYNSGEPADFSMSINDHINELSTKDVSRIDIYTSEGTFPVVTNNFKSKIKDILAAINQ